MTIPRSLPLGLNVTPPLGPREDAYELWRSTRVLATNLDDISICDSCVGPPWLKLVGDDDLRAHWELRHRGEE